MLRRHAWNIVSLLVIIACCVIAFNLCRMDYIRSAERIQTIKTFSPLLIAPTDTEGIYGNMDVDSAVFRYRTLVRDDEFWHALDRNLQGSDWQRIASEGEMRRYQRVIAPTGQQRFWWVDELRICHRRGEVVVG